MAVKKVVKDITKKPKKQGWRALVAEIGYERYSILLEEQVRVAREKKKRQLIKKHPEATFTDLNGFCWYSPETGYLEAPASEPLVWNEPPPPEQSGE
jgi:hypothetical protein